MFKKLIPKSDWLVYDNDPIMSKKIEDLSFPLNDKDIETISKMVSYVDASYNGEHQKYKIMPGIGIAAIQLGYPKKIIYIHLDDENNKEHKLLLANPTIIKESTNKMYLKGGEGCLSVKDKHKGLSIRKQTVVVKAFDIFLNKEIEIKASGILSACLQHEIDHNKNEFFYHRINANDPFYVDEEWEAI